MSAGRSAGTGAGQPRILIVEDDSFNLMFMREMLATLPVETFDAATADLAVERAEAERPDLILMDIQLRHGSGLEATRRIKANEDLRPIPIIAVTALAMQGDEQRIRQAGCDDYVAKPIEVDRFLATVCKYLELQTPAG